MIPPVGQSGTTIGQKTIMHLMLKTNAYPLLTANISAYSMQVLSSYVEQHHMRRASSNS